MRSSILWLLIVTGILAVVGCGESGPLYGTVVRKQHKPAWTETRLVRKHDGGYRVETRRHPPQWSIVLQIEDTEGDEGQRWIVISEERYDSVEVGGMWWRSDTVIEDAAP